MAVLTLSSLRIVSLWCPMPLLNLWDDCRASFYEYSHSIHDIPAKHSTSGDILSRWVEVSATSMGALAAHALTHPDDTPPSMYVVRVAQQHALEGVRVLNAIVSNPLPTPPN